MADSKPKKASTRPDLATLGGLLLAAGGILGGLVLEGGKLTDIAQVTALMIVLGGTIGAVMVTTPLRTLIKAAKCLGSVFFEHSQEPAEMIEEIISYATKARKNSIISLEADLPNIADPFLRKAISLSVDGTDLQELRKMMELDIGMEHRGGEAVVKVYEAAGGYSPTIGIIGAVLGLIQVMKHLENIEEVGRGIAVAFVATVYGVASANLFFLPAANKIKARFHHAMEAKELMLEGVCSIVEGMNPKLIRVKLEAFTQGESESGSKSKAPKQAAQAAVAQS
ncbi:MAG TPA: flagellar motor protein [Bryobacteraceae bacterium]|jgi:chemotaxis protein MotA|nr:flagellar motor protein [Bryobacteraceae bacterium]